MPDLPPSWRTALTEFVTAGALLPFLSAAAVLVVGLVTARLVAGFVDRRLESRMSLQHRMIARRGIFYGLLGLAVASALRQLGVDLSVLLGAAGILSVAVGFASQTSASNLISGLFLLGERPFVLGDMITVGSVTGEVVSIDLLSVKLRTFDNLLVRVPNENLLKTDITNLTHFPIRRFDLKLRVGFHEDLDRVRGILNEVASRNPLCLDEPQPMLLILGFGEHGVDLQFNVWAARVHFLELRFAMQRDVLAALAAEGIIIPLPHRVVSGPVDVRVRREPG